MGHIALCVAENKLPLHLLSDRLSDDKMSSIAFSDHNVYCYNNFLGLTQTREAIAYFLAKRFYGIDVSSKEDALKQVDPENVVLGSGCASLLNSLFYTLAEEGDAVLIPAPYYAAFESDMKVSTFPYRFFLYSTVVTKCRNDCILSYRNCIHFYLLGSSKMCSIPSIYGTPSMWSHGGGT